MPKQLNVNLAFTADTGQAQKSLNDLQKSLQEIAKLPGKASSLFDDTEIKNASKAAMELQQHLSAAVNVKTGNLDLSRLSTSLKSANKDLNSYYDQLVKIGPQGQEAFLKLAKSISTAEAPVTRINSKLAEMGTTLKNTARWQISSSILHGFMGTLQGAYGYAQDLNESLNNIRIVTGQSVDEMAKFAEQANKSAKALSTTTTAYTDAALIFYQQGLKGDAVTERTDTVVKMANVTRQSAEEVSSYMTAIWNNFDDGSVSLEHYADVITALGATTASSSAEIAEGLSKFASVADTIGLSYDYATSILSALVANTRQSADTIGTSLKTILARLQSVKLGETLDDGTELTKYTKALQTIGVSIFDLNGQLKDADDILDETAAKWDTLTKAQQAGVAQTVAGTRQYAQFIAMMENWGDVQKNIQTAQGAEGALQDQADIYAESWEAASKRVKAAAQGIYQDLLDDKFFIGLNDNLAKLLQTIDGVVKGFGGMKGVIASVGSLFLTYYAKNMPDALNNLRQNFMVFTNAATNEMIKMQTKTGEILSDMQKDNSLSNSFKTEAEGIATVIEMQKKYVLAQKSMTESQRRDYEARIANVQAMYGELKALELEIEKLQEEAKAKQAALSSNNIASELTSNRNQQDAIRTQQEEVRNDSSISDADKTKTLDSLDVMLQKLETKEGELLAKTALLKQEFDAVGLDPNLLSNTDKLKAAIDAETEKLKEQLISWRQISETGDELPQIAKKWKLNAAQIGSNSDKMKEFKKNVDLYTSSLKNVYENNKTAFKNTGIDQTISDIEKLKKEFDSGNISAEEFANEFEKLSATMKTQMDSAANEVNANLEDIRQRLAVMFKDNPEGLQELEALFDSLGIKIKQLGDSKINTRRMVEDPNNIFQASIAMTQFASAAMSTYAVINSLKNAFSTFDKALKGEADSFEVIGAIVSSFMATMMALNAVRKVSETLSKSSVIWNLAEAVAENTVVDAKIADIAATLGLEAAMAPLLIITLAIIAAMAALAFAVVAVVAIFKAVQAASPEGKLKALKEEAAECSKALEEAKTAAEELKSAFDNYDSLVDKLNECTRGTQEWRDALVEVNNAVLDLMADYPELAQYVTREDGQLKISYAGMTAMRNSADAAVINAQSASLKANTNVKNQEIDMQAESIASNNALGLPYWLTDKLYNDPQSLGSYDDIRQMIADNYDPTYEENPLDKDSAEFEKYLDEQLAAFKDIEGMDELVAAIQANTAAQEVGNQAIADNILANNAQVQGSKYADNVTAAAGDVYGKLYDDAMKNLENEGWGTSGISRATKVNDEAKRVFAEYAKAAGITGATLTDTTGTAGNRKFVYEDASGQEVTVSLDAMRKIKAAADAQEQLGEAAQGLIQTFAKLDQSGQAYDKALMDMLSDKNFEGSTQGEIDALKDLVANNEKGMAGVLGSQLGNQDGKLTEEEAQALGYESAAVMIEAFEKGIEDYDTAIENIGNNWLSAVQDAFSDLQGADAFKDLALNQQKAIGNAMNQAFAIGGEEGLKAFTNVIENIPTDNLDEFAGTLGTIDWQETSVSELSKKLQQAGIDTSNLSDEALQSLIDSMDGTFVSAEKLAGKFSELHSIIDGLSDGDSISAEDYDKLGSEYNQYFRLQLDGTYKLIGAAKELQDTLKSNQIEEFKNEIENRGSEIQRLEKIKSKNYDADSLSQTSYTKNDEGSEFAYTYDGSHAQEQLQFLSEFSQGNAELQQKIEAWQKDLADGSVDDIQVLNDIAAEVQSCTTEFENLDEAIQENMMEQYQMQLAIAGSAEDMKELKGFLDNGTISAEAFSAAAIELDRNTDLQNLDADELEDYADYLQEAALSMEGFNNKMSDTEAEIVAKGIMKMNKAIDTLADNFSKAGKDGDSWRDILEQSTETSQEYAEAMINTKKAVGELLDVSSDFVSNDFVKNHLEEIEKAATGDADAIDNLKSALADSIIAKIIFDNSDFITDAAAVEAAYAQLKADIPDIDVGVTLEGTDSFIQDLQNLVDSTGMTVDQVNALCDAFGFEAQYESDTQPVEYKVPLTTTEHHRTVTKTDPETGNPTDWTETEQITDSQLVSFEGAYTAFAISTNGESPKISGLTKKATGSSNNYSSSNPGGKSPGKKSSSGGKTPEHKTKDTVDKFEADPFHKVNKELEDVAHNLAMIDKKQSHLFGSELIASLKQENVQLEKQIGLHKEKLEIAKREAAAVRAELEAQGVAFDGDNIANYNAMLKAAEDQINALILQYNALSAAEQEAWEKQYEGMDDPIKQAEEYYEKFKKNMEKYESYMSTVYSEEEEILDEQYKIIENNYKAWETEIQVSLDLSQAKQDWNKFWQKVNKDIKSAFKDYAKEISDITTNFNAMRDGTLSTDMKAVNDIKDEIDKIRSGEGSDRYESESKAAQDLLKYSNQLREDAESLYDMYTEAWDSYLEGIDQVIDKWDDLITEFDDINDSLEHQAKVIELLYGDGDMAKQLNAQRYTVQKDNSLAKMETLRKSTEALEKERQELLAVGAKETDEDVKKLTDVIKENEKEMESEIENYLQTIANEFQNSVSMAMREMEKVMTNGTSYADVSQKWEDAQYAAEGYYDDVEKIYQLETLEGKWESALNSAKTLKSQQKLKTLMDEQLENLESKTELTEYDIQLAEKQLAVAQAQIALEEAQNNKNAMKLTRDESGNWSYQYVADDTDVASKQQALLDANQDWYEFTKQSWQDLTEEIWQDAQTAQERLTALMEEYNTADEARRAEIEAEYDYLYDYYYGEDGLIATKSKQCAEMQDDLNIATMNTLWSLYETDEDNYKLMTDEEKDLIEELRKKGVDEYKLLRDAVSGKDGIYDQMKDKCDEVNKENLAGWKSTASDIIKEWATNPDSLQKNIENMYSDVKKAQGIYDKAVKDGVAASGKEFDKIGGDNGELAKLAKKTEDAKEKTDELLKETDGISDMREAVEKLRKAWADVSSAIKNATIDLKEYLSILNDGGDSDEDSGGDGDTGGDDNGVGGGFGEGTGTGTGTPVDNIDKVEGVAAAIWMDGSDVSGWGTGATRKKRLAEKGVSAAQSYINAHAENGDIYKAWSGKRGQLSSYYYGSFDTGGYTGDWSGHDGKLALLHSKELVLNADDTKNILEAVSAVRSFTSLGESVASSISNGIANMVKSLMGLKTSDYSGNLTNSNTENANNTFDITMNVDGGNVEEIKQAILSLPTLASQYLSKR